MREFLLVLACADPVCECTYYDNKWFQEITLVLRHVTPKLPAELGTGAAAATYIAGQQCDEDARAYPGTQTALSAEDIVNTGRYMTRDARRAFWDVCIPMQVVLSLLCVQKFVQAHNVRSTLKWVQQMQNLLSFVEHCMDPETPAPIRAQDVKRYVQRWQSEKVRVA